MGCRASFGAAFLRKAGDLPKRENHSFGGTVYRLGIDLGTSYFKAGLFDPEGRLRGLGRVKVAKRPDDGVRCELATEDFWRSLGSAIDEAKTAAGAAAGDIASVGYSSQANSFLILDGNLEPLTPIVLWPDQRGEQVYPEVRRLWDSPDFMDTTGIGVECCPSLCVNKLRWFAREQPRTWTAAGGVMTLSDYLVHGLTGRRVGDSGTASLLGLLAVRKHSWNATALDLLEIDPALLSEPMAPGTVAGEIDGGRAAARLGLPPGIPLILGSLDHYMAAVGAGLDAHAGAVSVSLGTVVAAVNRTPSFVPRRGLRVSPAPCGAGYHQLACDGNGASVLEWYHRTFCPKWEMASLIARAGAVPSGCDGLVARPHADRYPGLAGFEGVRGHHTHAHFARAIIRSTADSLKTLLDNLCPDGIPATIVVTGGAAKREAGHVWLDLLAQTTGVRPVAADCPEPACRGAAHFVA